MATFQGSGAVTGGGGGGKELLGAGAAQRMLGRLLPAACVLACRYTGWAGAPRLKGEENEEEEWVPSRTAGDVFSLSFGSK